MTAKTEVIPRAFVVKRLHSLTGLWLVVYLIMHLFTNSQAALLIGDDGSGFIHSVNSIHELPYLPAIEIGILAFPILLHGIWGMYYAYRAKFNSFGGGGAAPYLPEYARNHAFTWQRITSWLLVVGILAHVIHMRFIEYPTSAKKDGHHEYMVRVTLDDGLYTLAERLDVKLYDANKIQQLRQDSGMHFEKALSFMDFFKSYLASIPDLLSNAKVIHKNEKQEILLEEQRKSQEKDWLNALQKRPLKDGEVIAVADNFGAVELLMVRDTFKMPIMLVLYTLLVLAACYHAFNGLWTCMISFGITLSRKSQHVMSGISIFLMGLVTLMGLSAIWLTYWINLKQ